MKKLVYIITVFVLALSVSYLFFSKKLIAQEVLGTLAPLASEPIKQAQMAGQWSACQSHALQGLKKPSIISDWIFIVGLKCSRWQAVSQKKVPELINYVTHQLKKKSIIFSKASESILSEDLKKTLDLSIEYYLQSEIKPDPAYLETIEYYLGHLKGEKSKIYFLNGHLSKMNHDYQSALNFYLLSLKLESFELSQKGLNQVEVLLNKNVTTFAASEHGETSQEESKSLSLLEAALARKDYNFYLQEGVKYLNEYLLSKSTEKVSQKIFYLFRTYLMDNGINQQRATQLLQNARWDLLTDWAKKLHRLGHYKPAYQFAIMGLDQRVTPELLYVAGRSSFYQGNYSTAQGFFARYVEQAPAGEEIDDVYLKLGLGFLRLNQSSSAISWFERAINTTLNDSYKLIFKYWLIRAYEVSKLPLYQTQLKNLKQEIIDNYPLSYYGLVLLAESNNFKLIKSQLSKPYLAVEKVTEFKKTAMDQVNWQRILLLAKWGWSDEAQLELKYYWTPTQLEARKQLLDQIIDFNVPSLKITIINGFQGDFFLNEKYLKAGYPKPFESFVNKIAIKTGLPSSLLFSLIRQESAFLPQVVSSSQAVGLMQVIPATALEVSKGLGLNISDWSIEGGEPEKNILIGSTYLNQMINSYEKITPLALAAYNYGPTRLSTWLEQRPTLISEIKASDSSGGGLNGIWIDELPTWETQFYVKAILRNWLIYLVLEKSEIKYEYNFWKSI